MADQLAFTPIRELASLIRDGDVSPVELTEQSLARLDEFGPAYNSLVTLTSERALETARRVESELGSGARSRPSGGDTMGREGLACHVGRHTDVLGGRAVQRAAVRPGRDGGDQA